MRRKITIPITTTATAYTANDVLFSPVNVENAAVRLGGDVKIISASLISKADKCPSVDLVFMEEDSLPGLNVAPGSVITTGGATLRSILVDNHVCGIVTLDEVTDGNTGALGGDAGNETYISTKTNVDLVVSTSLGNEGFSSTQTPEDPLSTNFHVFGVTKSAVTSTTTTDFTLILDIE